MLLLAAFHLLMLFSSYTFLFAFLPLVVLVFHLLERIPSLRLAHAWLLFASVVFYASGDIRFLWLLVCSIVLNFITAQLLVQQLTQQRLHIVKCLLAFGIGGNLAALAWFKYRGFIGDILGALMESGIHLGDIILPLGISFFTFQQIAYLVDASQGKLSTTPFLQYALFVTFFPQLIAGPIVHHAELLPQLCQQPRRVFRWDMLSIGITIFIFGLFKKVVIADSVAPFANSVFGPVDLGTEPTFYASWAGVAAFTFQIYFDFSGYSDMAIGLGYLFGVRLPTNFAAPYKATSIIDFWHRWHITLSRFLREYVYIPLGGNRHGSLQRYRNLLLTMAIGGMWHGAAWTYLAWGCLHGVFLAINHLWRDRVRLANDSPSPNRTVVDIALRWASRAMVLYLVAVTWVFFRSNTFAGATTILASMHGLNGFSLAAPFSRIESAVWLVSLLAIVWYLPHSEQVISAATTRFEAPLSLAHARDIITRQTHLCWSPSLAWSTVVALMAVTSVLLISRGSEFIYYHF